MHKDLLVSDGQVKTDTICTQRCGQLTAKLLRHEGVQASWKLKLGTAFIQHCSTYGKGAQVTDSHHTHPFPLAHARTTRHQQQWLSVLVPEEMSNTAEAENCYTKRGKQEFPGGAVVGSPPANAGDTGSSPGPGRSHMLRSN